MKPDTECADLFVLSTVDDLRAEILRLREDNKDLRASALRWKELYERALRGEWDLSVDFSARVKDDDQVHAAV